MGMRRQGGEKSRLRGAVRSPYWLEYKIFRRKCGQMRSYQKALLSSLSLTLTHNIFHSFLSSILVSCFLLHIVSMSVFTDKNMLFHHTNILQSPGILKRQIYTFPYVFSQATIYFLLFFHHLTYLKNRLHFLSSSLFYFASDFFKETIHRYC